MSKSRPLDADALARKQLNSEVQRRLEAFCREREASPESVRVLDWGCGRGEAVLLLLEQGFDAVGVEAQTAYLANGADYYRALGHDPERHLFGLDLAAGAKLPFADASIDFAFSEQVLEHVEDLDGLAAELARVLRPGGRALHVLPPHRGPIEEHLHLPIVHWLPKGRVRRAAIAAWMLVGFGPRDHPPGASLAERIRHWSRYSDEETFYRSPRTLRRCFERAGLSLRFVAHEHARLRALPVVGGLLKVPLVARAIGWVLTRFVVVHAEVRR